MKRQASIGELFAKKPRHGPSVAVELSNDTTTGSVAATSDTLCSDTSAAAEVSPTSSESEQLCTVSSLDPMWPACWTREQWLYFTHENEWLFCSNGKIGCSICCQVGNLGTYRTMKGQKMQLSKEWTSCLVNPYGTNKEKQLASLRKKIREHKLSASHIEAEKVKALAKCNILPEAVAEQEKELLTTTCNIFRTAYYVAKHDRPYLDHPELVDLQKENWCDMGRN